MREARIIIPDSCWSDDIAASLIASYGGLTVTRGEGHWVDSDDRLVSEPVRVVDVAGEDNAGLLGVASALLELGEEAVYVRDFGGTVRILDAADLSTRRVLG